jgi:hypothetical protein
VLLRTAGWLLHVAGDADRDDRRRLVSCADRCALAAARVQRIAVDHGGGDRLGRESVSW